MLFSGSSCKFGVMVTSHIHWWGFNNENHCETSQSSPIEPDDEPSLSQLIDIYEMDQNKQIARAWTPPWLTQCMHFDLPIPILQTHSVALAAFAACAFLALHAAGVSPKWGPPQSTVTWCNLHHHWSISGSYWFRPLRRGAWRVLDCSGPKFEGPQFCWSNLWSIDWILLGSSAPEPLHFCLRKDWRNNTVTEGQLGWGPSDGLVPVKLRTWALAYYLVGLRMVGDVSNFYQVGHCFLTCYLIQLIHVLITYQYIPSFLLFGRHRGMVPKNVVKKIKSQSKHSPLRIVATWWMNSAG